MTSTTFRRTLPAAVLALAAGGAGAQGAPSTFELDLPYRSAFDGYLPHADPTAFDWRGANDLVRRLGGHAGHLRGQERAKDAADKPGSPAAPTDVGPGVPEGRRQPARGTDGGGR